MFFAVLFVIIIGSAVLYTLAMSFEDTLSNESKTFEKISTACNDFTNSLYMVLMYSYFMLIKFTL